MGHHLKRLLHLLPPATVGFVRAIQKAVVQSQVLRAIFDNSFWN
jgi:hypothetical protein